MAQQIDTHVADSVIQALAAGMSESTVEGQHIKAIANLTALASARPEAAAYFNAAIATLNLSLGHVRDPRQHTLEVD